MRCLIAALLLVFAYPAAAEDVLLTQAEITATLTGKTALFYTSGDEQFFAADGSTDYWDGKRLTHGEWWAGGNRYCSTWGSSVASCYKVFRAANGTIVWVGDRNDRYVATMRDGDHVTRPAE